MVESANKYSMFQIAVVTLRLHKITGFSQYPVLLTLRSSSLRGLALNQTQDDILIQVLQIECETLTIFKIQTFSKLESNRQIQLTLLEDMLPR